MRVPIPEFDKVETGFEPLPAGRYTVQISNAEVRRTKSLDSSYINWELTVLGPTNAGRKLFLINSLKTDALWNLKSFLKVAGAKMDENGFNTEDAVGMKVDVTVEQEEYQGVVRNRVGHPYYPASLQ